MKSIPNSLPLPSLYICFMLHISPFLIKIATPQALWLPCQIFLILIIKSSDQCVTCQQIISVLSFPITCSNLQISLSPLQFKQAMVIKSAYYFLTVFLPSFHFPFQQLHSSLIYVHFLFQT